MTSKCKNYFRFKELVAETLRSKCVYKFRRGSCTEKQSLFVATILVGHFESPYVIFAMSAFLRKNHMIFEETEDNGTFLLSWCKLGRWQHCPPKTCFHEKTYLIDSRINLVVSYPYFTNTIIFSSGGISSSIVITMILIILLLLLSSSSIYYYHQYTIILLLCIILYYAIIRYIALHYYYTILC